MQWRVMVELSGAVGAKQVHEVHAGGSATPGCSAATLGLSLAEAKAILAGLHFQTDHRAGMLLPPYRATN